VYLKLLSRINAFKKQKSTPVLALTLLLALRFAFQVSNVEGSRRFSSAASHWILNHQLVYQILFNGSYRHTNKKGML
jgi:hypothetical protein